MQQFSTDILTVKDHLDYSTEQFSLSTSQDLETISELETEYIKNLENVKLTLEKFDEVMAKYKIEEFNPIDEKFDPQIHEALAMVNIPEKEPNTI